MRLLFHAGLTACLLLGAGCRSNDGAPVTIAHRFGASLFPENSRTGMTQALQRGYPGIEFDLVLTKDHIPVVSHDPWLNPVLCTTASGEELGADRILLKDHGLGELRAQFRCGGKPQPDHPAAQVLAETHLTLDEVIDALRPHPEVWVQLDVKFDPQTTEGPELFAQEIWGRWRTAGLSNRTFVSSPEPAFLRAVAAEGAPLVLLT